MGRSLGLHANRRWLNFQLGILFKSLRNRAGVTQVEVASLLGITPQYVANWERGSCCVPSEYIRQMLELFKVDLEAVFQSIYEIHREYLEAILIGPDKMEFASSAKKSGERARPAYKTNKIPKTYTRKQIQYLRKTRLGIGTDEFAVLLDVTGKRVEDWESGRKQPTHADAKKIYFISKNKALLD